MLSLLLSLAQPLANPLGRRAAYSDTARPRAACSDRARPQSCANDDHSLPLSVRPPGLGASPDCARAPRPAEAPAPAAAEAPAPAIETPRRTPSRFDLLQTARALRRDLLAQKRRLRDARSLRGASCHP